MRNLRNELISSEDIANEFKLDNVLAHEIVADETQRALKANWLAWALLICGLLVAAFLFLSKYVTSTTAVFIVLVTVFSWFLLGRFLARSNIRERAREKSLAIHGSKT